MPVFKKFNTWRTKFGIKSPYYDLFYKSGLAFCKKQEFAT